MRNQDAEAILTEAIEKYPQAADLRSFLGYAYKRMGRVAEARTQFEAAVKLNSSMGVDGNRRPRVVEGDLRGRQGVENDANFLRDS
jgi:cytochrome c-type biogenesis protein CcmH/NrfG